MTGLFQKKWKRKTVSCILSQVLVLVLLSGVMLPKQTVTASASSAPARNFANVVVCAYFSGDTNSDAANEQYFKDNTNKIIKMYNGTHGRSMTNYLKSVSYNKFNVVNIFPQYLDGQIIACKLDETTEATAKGMNADYQIIKEVIDKCPSLENQLIDYDNDGYIDNLTIILKGGDGTETTATSLVCHKNSIHSENLQWMGKPVGCYNMINTYSLLDSAFANKEGVIIHEFLHTLDYPDLYTNDDSNPVGIWDIMSGVSYRPTIPLAYLRMHFTNWMDIPTITTTTNLTFSEPLDANGNQAYILKSPLNDREFFVIEYRKTNFNYDEDSLDRDLAGTGLIVYRVNEAVEGLSNRYGGTGIYVFRPQPGQDGYDARYPNSTNYAYLSDNPDSNSVKVRSSLGTDDLSKTMAQGAITYSDGSNSGIIIDTVKTESDSSMSCRVIIPGENDYDIWENTGFTSGMESDSDTTAYRTIGLYEYNGRMYAVAAVNNKVKTYQYVNDMWSEIGNEKNLENNVGVTPPQFFELNGQSYVAIEDSQLRVHIYGFSDCGIEGEEIVFYQKEGGEQQYGIIDNQAYFANAVYGTPYQINLYSFDGQTIHNYGTVITGQSGALYGRPAICSIGNEFYLLVRNSLTKKLEIYKKGTNNQFTMVDNSIKSSDFNVMEHNGKLYIASSGIGEGDSNNKIGLFSFDGVGVSQLTAENDLVEGFVCLEESEGNIYVMVSPSSSTSNAMVYRYDSSSSALVKEGESIGARACNGTFALLSNGNTLYVAFRENISNGKLYIKKKVKSVVGNHTGEGTVSHTHTYQTIVVPPTVNSNGYTKHYCTGCGAYYVDSWVEKIDEGTVSHTHTYQTIVVPPTVNSNGYTKHYCTGCGAYYVDSWVEKIVPDVTVSYRTHIQSIGWEDAYKRNGEMSGTSGRALRLEAIQMKIDGNPNLGIQYVTHCQTYGWLTWSTNNEVNGTSGEAKRLESIQIRLTGADKDKYDVYYRVHTQSVGWMSWAKNGEPSGTAGMAKRLEGIQILVVKKGTSVSNNVANIVPAVSQSFISADGKQEIVSGYDNVHVTYQTHVQKDGWQKWMSDGTMSGTSGRSLRLEGIKIKLTNKPYSGGIRYSTHVQKIGWQGFTQDGNMSGTSGRSLRLEAIKIELTGEMATYYDVYYRVHAQNVGWMGWAKNGEEAGTAGYSRRLEGIQIVLVPKNGAAPSNNYNGINANTTTAYLKK